MHTDMTSFQRKCMQVFEMHTSTSLHTLYNSFSSTVFISRINHRSSCSQLKGRNQKWRPESIRGLKEINTDNINVPKMYLKIQLQLDVICENWLLFWWEFTERKMNSPVKGKQSFLKKSSLNPQAISLLFHRFCVTWSFLWYGTT